MVVGAGQHSGLERLRRQLIRDEGQVLEAYQDHLGFWTIGVGRLIDGRKGGGISPEEAAYLLDNDISRKAAELDAALPWCRGLDEVRRGVLQNMAFQMGVQGLVKFKTTLGLVQSGSYKQASQQMLKSLWARQTPQRAARLARQMETGVWQ
jgi:lysozyme